jgi:hypothetical protein
MASFCCPFLMNCTAFVRILLICFCCSNASSANSWCLSSCTWS